MPLAPRRVCTEPGCPNRVASGYCPQHQRARRVHQTRFFTPSAGQSQVSYGRAWRKARAEFLAEPGHTFCACGCEQLADTVDHIVPHRGDPVLFWDRSNWQAMAKACHDRKTAGEVWHG